MKVIEREKIEASEDGFSVMQFNTLAFLCATTDPKRGFAFVPKKCLTWDFRFPGLISEIKEHSSDLISLEEVDRFSEFKEALGKDYKSLYHRPKVRGLGNAVFWNPNKFKLLKSENLYFRGIVCLFEFLPLKKQIVFSSVHLKAKVGNEKMRLKQVEALCRVIKIYSNNGRLPVIIAGDFNDVQDSPMYEFLVKKSGYDSVYGNYKEPYSTYKKRKEEDVCRTIDYIFHNSKHTKVENVLEIPDKEVFAQRLPAMNYPSDHLMIKATFALCQ